MPDQPQYVLITTQPPGSGGTVNVYGSPDVDEDQLKGAGALLADGASPPMDFRVLELQPAKWDDA